MQASTAVLGDVTSVGFNIQYSMQSGAATGMIEASYDQIPGNPNYPILTEFIVSLLDYQQS